MTHVRHVIWVRKPLPHQLKYTIWHDVSIMQDITRRLATLESRPRGGDGATGKTRRDMPRYTYNTMYTCFACDAQGHI